MAVNAISTTPPTMTAITMGYLHVSRLPGPCARTYAESDRDVSQPARVLKQSAISRGRHSVEFVRWPPEKIGPPYERTGPQ
ncbi:hypothetical protein GORHZ_117_00110 [Gordonia rhizosphera NBRC 16068]|uniref:Uncharacterized protein n=1 Tax=Gordonia rhizosphera NBRC 16068 TaxID=1108045 RepID=K6V3S0_9ACTN|nr:hypothetical protein GORHZ_117_00110 [Gordonia rhizosphera NBRC 16068]